MNTNLQIPTNQNMNKIAENPKIDKYSLLGMLDVEINQAPPTPTKQ